MLVFHPTAPGGPRLRYTYESYVPARRLVSDSGLTAHDWWVDSSEPLDGRPTWEADLALLGPGQLAHVTWGRRSREQFEKHFERAPTEADRDWLVALWPRPDEDPASSPDLALGWWCFLVGVPASAAVQAPAPAPGAPAARPAAVTTPAPAAAAAPVAPVVQAAPVEQAAPAAAPPVAPVAATAPAAPTTTTPARRTGKQTAARAAAPAPPAPAAAKPASASATRRRIVDSAPSAASAPVVTTPAAPVVAAPAAPAATVPAAKKAAKSAPVAAAPVAAAPVVVPVAAPEDPSLRRPRGDLLMVLRARIGATSIYSASQRRMVALHYP